MGFKRKHGAFKGIGREYTLYRYGSPTAGAVYVPGRDLPKQARNKDAREHMIGEAKRLLASGTSSPFEFEGVCRHGIRSGLCLDGFNWQISDDVAAFAVTEALRRMGARRPSWEEGQPEATTAVECCAWCGRELEIGSGRKDRFCDSVCARSYFTHRTDREGRKASAMHKAAKRIIYREPRKVGDHATTIPDRNCESYGKLFHPVAEHIRTCSVDCRGAHAKEVVKVMTCLCCGTSFPASRAKRSPFCSESCSTMQRQFAKGYLPKRITPLAFDHFITVPVALRPAWLTPARFDELLAA